MGFCGGLLTRLLVLCHALVLLPLCYGARVNQARGGVCLHVIRVLDATLHRACVVIRLRSTNLGVLELLGEL